MKTDSATASHDSLLVQVLDGYLSACRRGERPDGSDLVAKHPEIASELRTCLASLEFIQQAEQSSTFPDLGGEIAAATGNGVAGSPAGPTLGDFRIVRQIGRGGMGVVYEAEQISLQRRVALKTLPFAGVLDQRQLARFKNEALAAAALQHPNIVPVYAVGCERGVHYYAMQYIAGQNLAELITEQRVRAGLAAPGEAEATEPLGEGTGDGEQGTGERKQKTEDRGQTAEAVSTVVGPKGSSTQPTKKERQAYYREVARIGQEVAEALAHAHAEGVVHRDIKPSNLMLDAGGKIWITDFGLAQTRSESGLTMTGDLVGTLRYMSPEQALGKRVPIDHRTDIYSLGVTLYELTTLRPMLHGADREDLLRQIAFDEPAPPRKYSPDISLDLETILLKAVAKDPRERYDTAQSLADDLARFLNSTPILARRPTPRQHAARWCRRHSTLATSLACVLIAGLIFAAGSSWWIARDRYQQQQDRIAAVSKALAEAQAQRAAAERSAAAERQANAKAQKSLQQLDDGNQIIFAIFKDLDLRATGHGAMPLERVFIQRLVTAAAQIEGESIGDPLIVAQLQERLAMSLGSLGEAKVALDLSEMVLDTRKRLLGDEDPETLRALNAVGLCLQNCGQYDKSLAILTGCVETMKNRLGTDHPDTLNATNSLASAYYHSANVARAVELWEYILPVQQTKHAGDRRTTLRVMNNLANGYMGSNRLDKAVPMLEENVRLHKDTLGPQHADTLASMNNLAKCYSQVGKHAKAVQLHQETLDLMQNTLGSDHPSTLVSMNTLGAAYATSGDFERAQPTFENVVRLRKQSLGPTHPATLASMGSLASTYNAMGKATEELKVREELLLLEIANLGTDNMTVFTNQGNLAELHRRAGHLDRTLEILEDLVPRMKTVLGPSHPDSVMRMADLAMACGQAGHGEEAARWFAEYFEQQRKQSQPNDPRLAGALSNAVIKLLACERFQDAEQYARECLAIRELTQPDDWRTSNVRSQLGGALLGMKRYEEAKPLLEQGYEGMKRREVSIPAGGRVRLAEALDRLIRLSTELSEPDAIKKWEAERALYVGPEPDTPAKGPAP